MALSDKNIVITPNIGQTADPKIVFSGADGSTGANNITLTAYPTNSGTLSFDGSAGQLFSITNSLTGTLFSVNDISGIPSIEVIDTGLVRLTQYSGRVLLGTGTDNASDKLQVVGNIGATGSITASGSINAVNNIAAGTITVGTGATGATGSITASGRISATSASITTGATGYVGATGSIGSPAGYFNNLFVDGVAVSSGGGGSAFATTSLQVTGTNGATGATGSITASGTISSSRSIGASSAQGAFAYGTLNYTDGNIMGSWASTINSYNQLLLQNGSNGTAASTNFVVSNDQATNSTFYGELGMNSSLFGTGVGGASGASGAFLQPNTVYVASQSSDLAIGTFGAQPIHFVVNNGAQDAMTINSNGRVSVNPGGATGATGALLAIGVPATTVTHFASTGGGVYGSPELAIESTKTYTTTSIVNYSTNGAPVIAMGRSKSGTLGTLTTTTSGSTLGAITFDGVHTNSQFANAAWILVNQDGAAGATRVPGKITFHTSNGVSTVEERFNINAAGGVNVANFLAVGTLIGATGATGAINAVNNIAAGTITVGTGATGATGSITASGGIVSGSITCKATGGEGGQISLNNTTDTASAYNFDVDSSNHARLFTTQNNTNLSLGTLAGTGGTIALFTAAAERMRIDSVGGVNVASYLAVGTLTGATGATGAIKAVNNIATGTITVGTGATGATGSITASGAITTTTSVTAASIGATGGTINALSAQTIGASGITTNTLNATTIGVTTPPGISATSLYIGGATGTFGATGAMISGHAAIGGTLGATGYKLDLTGNFKLSGSIDENVYAVVDAAGVALSPQNGTIQTWTLGAARTPTQGTWEAGESMTLMINDGTAFTVTWTSIPVTWVGGVAPTLALTGFTVIELWKVGTTVYGALVGQIA